MNIYVILPVAPLLIMYHTTLSHNSMMLSRHILLNELDRLGYTFSVNINVSS